MTAAKPDPPFTSAAEIAESVRMFESCQLPSERWTHRAHLAVAAAYLRSYPLTDAIERARTHIRQYNASRGNQTGYHETITVLFMRLVAREFGAVPAGPGGVRQWPGRAVHDGLDTRLLHDGPALVGRGPRRLRRTGP